jgi:hypothetical protein
VLAGPNEKYRKSTDFRKGKPSDIIVFLDERININDGWFWSPSSRSTIRDLPAISLMAITAPHSLSPMATPNCTSGA